MGQGQNDVYVTFVPADQPPHLGAVGWSLKGVPGYPTADSSCQIVSGTVTESSCKNPWGFSDYGYDLDHDPAPLRYDWNWGDGTAHNCPATASWANKCSGGSMAHSYAKAGTYTIKVTVKDEDGQTATATTQVTVVSLPPTATETFSRGLGSTVVSRPRRGGKVTTALVLPKSATKVTDTSTVAGCGTTACAVAARRRPLLLGKLVKRHVHQGALILKLGPTNHKLLAHIRTALRAAHEHNVRATLTIVIKQAPGKTIRIIQHIKLRF
jgi:hypothetical protein